MKRKIVQGRILFLIFLCGFFLFYSCASRAVKAEEYFSLGMAYFELGQNNAANRDRYFQEAEKWLNRARSTDKTMTASDYNLGRLAFEAGRYEEAAKHFENVLVRDPENVMAIKSAAYSRIKNGDLYKAETLYDRVITLIPESADDGYNYALVLYSIKKYERCEDLLGKFPYSLEENQASMLLYARAQRAQGKVEAVDSYAKWAMAAKPVNPQGLYEYAKVLEDAGFYAKALEQYPAAIDAVTKDTETPKKSLLMFEEARLILVADPENEEGPKKLEAAVKEGFSDAASVKELLGDERIKSENKEKVEAIYLDMINENKEPPEDDPKT